MTISQISCSCNVVFSQGIVKSKWVNITMKIEIFYLNFRRTCYLFREACVSYGEDKRCIERSGR